MPRNATVTMGSDWVELTSADAAYITVQNQSGYKLELLATTGAAPSSADGAMQIPVSGAILNEALADLFPGATGATRVWGRGYGPVMVSHV